MPLSKMEAWPLPDPTSEPSMPPDAEPGDILILAKGGRVSWAKVYPETRYWYQLQWTLITDPANIADNLYICSGIESIEPGTTSAATDVTEVDYNEFD
jgi:hypothetical protein